MAVPYTFATATSSIPLSQLDSNFSTPITLGNTSIQLGNTVTTLNNMTLANVTVSSVASTFPNNYLANSTATLGNATITLGGTTTTVGNLTLTNATISSGTYSVTNATVSGDLTLSGGTANGVAYLNGSKVLTTGSALVFDGSNLGLGVTPSDTLGYGKALDIQGTAGSALYTRSATNSSTVYGLFAYDNNAVRVNVGAIGTNNYLRFVTAVGEAARITSGGDLLVGTTSTNGRINVLSGSATQSAITTNGVTGDTAYQGILVSKFDNDSTTSQNFIQFQINNGGANCGKITANGANTAAFGSTSDQRVKENISDLPSQLENIMALRPVEFDYIESYGGGHQIGFIAQEMQQVYPDVVSEDASEEKIKSITGWSKTEARLVKALQEMKQIVDAQAARIAALESK